MLIVGDYLQRVQFITLIANAMEFANQSLIVLADWLVEVLLFELNLDV